MGLVMEIITMEAAKQESAFRGSGWSPHPVASGSRYQYGVSQGDGRENIGVDMFPLEAVMSRSCPGGESWRKWKRNGR